MIHRCECGAGYIVTADTPENDFPTLRDGSNIRLVEGVIVCAVCKKKIYKPEAGRGTP